MTRSLLLFFLVALARSPGNSQSSNPVSLQLISPATRCTSPCQRRAVVFIHGFWGDETTWQNSESHRTWPQLMGQDARFKDSDVFEARYPTSALPWAKGNDIRLTTIARDFNDLLQHEIVPYYQTVSLIGHSMGGNVILTSILFLKFTNPNAHEILTKYKNIVLLGTPIEGADLANMGYALGMDQKLIALKPIVENELPVLIEMALTDIDGKRALLRLPDLNFALAYEEEPLLKVGGVPVGKVIVSRKSATALGNVTHGDRIEEKGFERNHLTLVKPYDQCDCVYRWVADILLGLPHSSDPCRAPCP